MASLRNRGYDKRTGIAALTAFVPVTARSKLLSLGSSGKGIRAESLVLSVAI